MPRLSAQDLKSGFAKGLFTSLLLAGSGLVVFTPGMTAMAHGIETTAPVIATHETADFAASLPQVLGGDLADLPELGANFKSFTLDNGLQVVVIPDHRAPVVTHMIWYKVGAADEVAGQSGIAHFLEHLMFKGSTNFPDGEFSRIVASVGGQENAFTSQDYTAYFQRVAKEHLGEMMEMEADRMANLELREEQVAPELQVIHEERASRVDNNPSALLSEALQAALYRNHPYGTPIIGWDHEISELTRQKALDFYNLYYTPNNAILIVAGDVTEAEVKTLAETYYGKVERRAEPGPRIRPVEPPQRTARTLTLRHERVRQPNIRQAYVVPSDATAQNGEAEALQLLAYIMGDGTNSRIYQSLIVDQKIASSAGAYYQSGGLDDTSFNFYGTPTLGNSPDMVMNAIAVELEKLITDGVTEEEVARAKRAMLASAFYAQDSQVSLARIVGANLTSGSSLEEIRSWAKDLASVKPEAIQAVAKKYLAEHRSVTGYLLPPKARKTAQAPEMPAPMKEAKERSAKATSVDAQTVNRTGFPKVAPRNSQKVPAPRERPVITLDETPRAKPAETLISTPSTSNEG